MITIDQLLESVDLDFEPRWVTKNALGIVAIRSGEKPKPESPKWIGSTKRYESFGQLKLSEFDGKDWTECIYEVPRKVETTGKIEKLETTEKQRFVMLNKINELIDAVNELKEKFALPTLNPDLTDEDLRKMMRDPKYWRDKDAGVIQKVQNGFNKLYGDNVLKAKGE